MARGTSSGQHLRRSGAAGCTTFADSQHSLLLPRTRTIAQMGSPIGRQVGPRRRRCGAAHTTARAALVGDALRLAPPPLLTTATRASPIGSLAGALRRSSGAARTQERAARSRAEAAPEGESRTSGTACQVSGSCRYLFFLPYPPRAPKR